MRNKVIFLIVVSLLLAPTYASSLSNKKNELNSTKQKIESAKGQLNSNKQSQEAIEKEMAEVDKQINKVEETIRDLETKLKEKEEQLARSEEELEAAILEKSRQYEATKDRMVQMYKNQKIGYIQVIFSSNSFWEALNRIEYIKRISEQDNTILDNYKKQVAIIENKKKAIEDEKNELEKLRQSEVEKRNELKQILANKDKKLDELAQKAGMLREQIENMENIADELAASIKKLTEKTNATVTSSAKYTGGKFTWPVPGYYYISSEFGGRTSPISGKYEFHTGIDIPAEYGNNVLAAADGVVITSGWVRGYGNTIMINHGNGLVTLYAHNSSLVVSNGQTVKAGQVIAKIGSTGYSTGNHCHFEVRKNGSAVSPWNYVSK